MSKLAKQITATRLNEKARVMTPFNISTTLEKPISCGLHTKFRFMAQFGAEYLINDDTAERPEPIAYTLARVRQGVVEEVFGEFRPYIRELEHALYMRDYKLAHTKLRELEKEMFSV